MSENYNFKQVKGDWRASDIPTQKGRSVIITGTGGLGYETALELSRAGAEVIMAGRNRKKGEESINKIRRSVLSANIRFEELDLADLISIKKFTERMKDQRKSLDLLINNAGVMTPPQRKITKDGFELQFGTNFLGHFALTAGLLPLLKKGKNPRVVNVSSLAHLAGIIDFENLQSERSYKPMVAYSQSKLANLMFSFELERRSENFGWGIKSIAVHPGISRTELIPNGAGKNSPMGILRRAMGPIMFQAASQGALPSLYAATSPNAEGGAYYGPSKFNEMRGLPKLAKPAPQSRDEKVAERLWDVSKNLTDVDFDEITSIENSNYILK
ncbi:MAG TPA: oxidoreductase [Clostridium sp.]